MGTISARLVKFLAVGNPLLFNAIPILDHIGLHGIVAKRIQAGIRNEQDGIHHDAMVLCIGVNAPIPENSQMVVAVETRHSRIQSIFDCIKLRCQ